MDIWKSKQLTLELVDLEQVSVSSLVFQAALISFWLSMCFTIYRSQSTLAGVPWAILSSPSLSASATLFPHRMLCILLSEEVQTTAGQTSLKKTFFWYFVIKTLSWQENHINNKSKSLFLIIQTSILHNITGKTQLHNIFMSAALNKFWLILSIALPSYGDKYDLVGIILFLTSGRNVLPLAYRTIFNLWPIQYPRKSGNTHFHCTGFSVTKSN